MKNEMKVNCKDMTQAEKEKYKLDFTPLHNLNADFITKNYLKIY